VILQAFSCIARNVGAKTVANQVEIFRTSGRLRTDGVDELGDFTAYNLGVGCSLGVGKTKSKNDVRAGI
jgi:hypothetical protein